MILVKVNPVIFLRFVNGNCTSRAHLGFWMMVLQELNISPCFSLGIAIEFGCRRLSLILLF